MHHITVSGREKISSCESFVKPLSRRGVILDVDGTLSPEVSWTALTRRLGGSVAEHSRIFDQYRHGEISYVESRIQLIGLWQSSGNASRQNFLDIFESFTLRPGAISLVVELEAAGFELCIITGSFDLYAQSVATKLGVRNFYANTPLYFDSDGEIQSYDYTLDQSSKKLEQFELFCRKRDILPEACFAVGDGEGDIGIFQATKHGILLKHPDQSAALRNAAWKTVGSLEDVPDTIGI